MPTVRRVVDDGLDRGLGATLVEVDEHIVEHNRQFGALADEIVNQRESDREKQLLSGPAAELIDPKGPLSVVIDNQRLLAQRRPDALDTCRP